MRVDGDSKALLFSFLNVMNAEMSYEYMDCFVAYTPRNDCSVCFCYIN